jgi:LmbE family N-acetylglucosaminyl deacetylase
LYRHITNTYTCEVDQASTQEHALIQARCVLAFSPHLDDAALSAGALLAGLAVPGTEVHVVTLFAGSPQESLSLVAHTFHHRCGLPHDATAVAVRRREDLEAMRALGARAHHAGLLDALYRRRSDGHWLCGHDQAMFDAMSPEEDIMATVRASVERFRDLVVPDLIITCAAIGGHMDHLISRTVVTAVAEITETNLLLWEDLPYAIGTRLSKDIGKLMRIPVSPVNWACKLEAVARYASQTRMLWPDRGDWAKDLRDHALDRGAGQLVEVLWNARGAGDARRSRPFSAAVASQEDLHTQAQRIPLLEP